VFIFEIEKSVTETEVLASLSIPIEKKHN